MRAKFFTASNIKTMINSMMNSMMNSIKPTINAFLDGYNGTDTGSRLFKDEVFDMYSIWVDFTTEEVDNYAEFAIWFNSMNIGVMEEYPATLTTREATLILTGECTGDDTNPSTPAVY